MIKMTRHESPQYLEENKNKWTQKYLQNKPKAFSWYDGVYEKLLDDLKEQTGSHCAFCDRAMSPDGDTDEEIEHFKPKSFKNFPELAYEWTNLYPICPKCNKRH